MTDIHTDEHNPLFIIKPSILGYIFIYIPYMASSTGHSTSAATNSSNNNYASCG
jgi:hypothetical protein